MEEIIQYFAEVCINRFIEAHNKFFKEPDSFAELEKETVRIVDDLGKEFIRVTLEEINRCFRASDWRKEKWHIEKTNKKQLITSLGTVCFNKTLFASKTEKTDEKLITRENTIVRTSVIGIIANLFLAAFKAVIGLMSNSIAIVLDAVKGLGVNGEGGLRGGDGYQAVGVLVIVTAVLPDGAAPVLVVHQLDHDAVAKFLIDDADQASAQGPVALELFAALRLGDRLLGQGSGTDDGKGHQEGHQDAQKLFHEFSSSSSYGSVVEPLPVPTVDTQENRGWQCRPAFSRKRFFHFLAPDFISQGLAMPGSYVSLRI